MKFGGTSVGDTQAIEASCRTVRENLDKKPFVVVSALAGVTDNLLRVGRLAVTNRLSEAFAMADSLEKRHAKLLPVAGYFIKLRELLQALSQIGVLTLRSQDLIAAYGEDMSSQIFAARLREFGIEAIHIDARSYIATDDNFGQAQPLFDVTYRQFQRIHGILDTVKKRVVVMGGFVGATQNGVTTTLGRGGSDYSAVLAAAAMGAKEIQIWTDVSGVMTADPKIEAKARTIKHLSFAEASELANFGAKVLHPKTIEPAMEKNIPVYILNSWLPAAPGTKVTRDTISCQNIVKSIACKRDVSVVTVMTSRMLGAIGFLSALFGILKNIGVSVDMVSTSEVSVSFTLDDPGRGGGVTDALRRPEWGVSLENNLALVCLVGSDMKFSPGVAARAFGSIRDLHVRMISHGASMTNLAFLVRKEYLEEAVRRLHTEFFSEFDPEVFEEPGI